MRIIATQFGILFALLAFSGQLLVGKTLGQATLSGTAIGAAILLTLIATDTLIDRYLGRKYGIPAEGIEEASIATDGVGNSRTHGTSGKHAA